jgi:cytochrome c oxidase cbb3-type subunit 3
LDGDDPTPEPVEARSAGPWWIFGLIGLFLVGGLAAFTLLSRRTDPVPPEIAADPLLVRGREIYLVRCVACHGQTGQGDGPLAKSLTPRPRNLASDPWKYGEKPEQVLAVLSNGVKDTQMPGWAGTYELGDLKAIAAYVYQIARKPIPNELR